MFVSVQRSIGAAAVIVASGVLGIVSAQDPSSYRDNTVHTGSQQQETRVNQQKADTASHDLSPAFAERRNRHSNLVADFMKDQKDLWTSPARLRASDSEWLVPVAGLTAGLLATDKDFSRHLSNDPKKLDRYIRLSNAGIAGIAGGTAAIWVWSHRNHNAHWQETGYLATKAAVNSLILSESLKYGLGRARPNEGASGGAFFQGDNSFPSEHTAA